MTKLIKTKPEDLLNLQNGDYAHFVEDGIAKKKKVNLLYKGSGFILVDGNISEKDLIITTRMPDNLNNQKVTILN